MNEKSAPTLFLSLIPVIFLIVLLTVSVRMYGSNSLDGANQVILLIAALLCTALSILVNKTSWKDLERGIIHNIASSTPAILILLLIGALSGTWMVSGIVPAMIYYGLQIIHPVVFLATACILCAIVSVASGSSWTTVATIGVAMIGIGSALGFEEGWIAGAVISGAYFGDKISPLSDTTNLAASISGTNLFSHIRYMLYTTVPTLILTLLIFGVAGLFYRPEGEVMTMEYSQILHEKFHISVFLFIVPIITLILIIKKIPAIITLFISALLGGITMLIAQPADICVQLAGGEYGIFETYFRAVMQAMFGATSIETGNPDLNELVSTRGMAGMMNTVWLIISAMVFGGVMESSGMLNVITASVLKRMKKTFSTVAYTAASCIFVNIAASDQFLAIIVPAKMFSGVYKKKGLAPELLSRTIEDSATVTSVLIPWNTCGMTQATVLGVATLTYLPYSFFNLISPLMTLFIAAIGYKIKKTGENSDGMEFAGDINTDSQK